MRIKKNEALSERKKHKMNKKNILRKLTRLIIQFQFVYIPLRVHRSCASATIVDDDDDADDEIDGSPQPQQSMME